jgi:predicted RNA-binding Zn-ribbon protein involved in translation (DUF1610 family)
MAKGICVVCGKQVGGFLQSKGYACPGCGKCYCEACSPKTGSLFKKPTCPDCGRQLIK